LPGWHAGMVAFMVNMQGRKFPIDLPSGRTWISTAGLESGHYLLVVPGCEENVFPGKIVIIKQ
jgi:hypothetical protein